MLVAAEKGDSQVQNETTDSNDQTSSVKTTRARGRWVEQLDIFLPLVVMFMSYSIFFFFYVEFNPFLSSCCRYQKRERGKLVKSYSSQDLEGILVCSQTIPFSHLSNFKPV